MHTVFPFESDKRGAARVNRETKRAGFCVEGGNCLEIATSVEKEQSEWSVTAAGQTTSFQHFILKTYISHLCPEHMCEFKPMKTPLHNNICT